MRVTGGADEVMVLHLYRTQRHQHGTSSEMFFSKIFKDMTLTFKEQVRQIQFDFLESMKVFEEMHEFELPAATHIVAGRLVNTTKTLMMWESKQSPKVPAPPQQPTFMFVRDKVRPVAAREAAQNKILKLEKLSRC